MKAPEVKNRKKAENAFFHSFEPKMHFWARKLFFGHFEHFGALLHFLFKMTNGFTRAYETQAGSVLAKKLSFLRQNAPKCQNGENGAIFDF